jgi:hypothetical protein
MEGKEGKQRQYTGSPVKILERLPSSNPDTSSDESLKDIPEIRFKSRQEYPLEVQPINKERRCTYFCYGRIMIEKLTKKTLKDIFISCNADIDVIEEPDSYVCQYKTKPPISINKVDGKFYSYSNEEMNQQARIIWEILRKHGYIEDPHRQYIYNNRSDSMWKE